MIRWMDGGLEGSKQKWVNKELWKFQADIAFYFSCCISKDGSRLGAFHGEKQKKNTLDENNRISFYY